MEAYALSGGYVASTVGPDWPAHVIATCPSVQQGRVVAAALREFAPSERCIGCDAGLERDAECVGCRWEHADAEAAQMVLH